MVLERYLVTMAIECFNFGMNGTVDVVILVVREKEERKVSRGQKRLHFVWGPQVDAAMASGRAAGSRISY